MALRVFSLLMRRRVLATPLLLVLGLPGAAGAQVPDGSLIVSSLYWPTRCPGPAGLYFVDPHGPLGVTPVTGLPPQIAGPFINPNGSDWVLRRPSDGALIASGGTTPATAFVMTLVGGTVARVTPHALATITSPTTTYGTYAALLSEERVLVALDYLTMGTPGPLATSLLGIVTPSTGAVTPIRVSPKPKMKTRGVAVDEVRGVVYVGMHSLIFPRTSQIYRIPFPRGGTPSAVFPNPIVGGITGLAVERDGQLLAGGINTATGVFRVDPATGAVTWFQRTNGWQVWAIRLDTVADSLYFLDSTSGHSVYRMTPASPASATTFVTSGPTGGWGQPTGIDINPCPEPYGAGSGSGQYSWLLSPNAGGLPTLGNRTFRLGVAGAPTPWRSFLALGTRPALPTPPLNLLVTPAVWLGITSAPTMSVPLSIPRSMAFRQLPFYVQSFHVDTSLNVGASPGLHFTIL